MQQKPRVRRPWPLMREGAESELLAAFERPLQIRSDGCQSQASGMRRPSLPLKISARQLAEAELSCSRYSEHRPSEGSWMT